MAKLTKTQVDRFNCAPNKSQAFLWCTSPAGFGLRCTKEGIKSFVVQTRINGTQRRETIGRYGVFTVDQARQRANELIRDMRMGVDPRTERAKKLAQAVTLREIASRYVDEKRTKYGPLRPKSRDDIIRMLDAYLIDWADRPIAGITRDRCIEKFDQLSKRSSHQANKTFVNLRALCNWARELYATDDHFPLLPVNPVTRMFKVRRKNPEPPRTRRVPIDKVGAVWRMLTDRRLRGRTIDDRAAAGLIAFLMLTGARLGESSKLTWADVNLEAGWLRFDGSVTKNHQTLVLPITTLMREVLDALPRRPMNDYVFPSWGPKSGHIGDPRATMDAVSDVAGTHLSAHDLRRTFDDCAKECRVDADDRRRLLNHISSGGIHAKHYSNSLDPRALSESLNAIHHWISHVRG